MQWTCIQKLRKCIYRTILNYRDILMNESNQFMHMHVCAGEPEHMTSWPL